MTDDHWKLFNELWEKYGLDDIFGPKQYAVSYRQQVHTKSEPVSLMDRLYLMKLPKSKLLTPYGSICFLYLLDFNRIVLPYPKWLKKIFHWFKEDPFVKSFRIFRAISDDEIKIS